MTVDENCADALAEFTRFVGQKPGRVLLGVNIMEFCWATLFQASAILVWVAGKYCVCVDPV